MPLWHKCCTQPWFKMKHTPEDRIMKERNRQERLKVNTSLGGALQINKNCWCLNTRLDRYTGFTVSHFQSLSSLFAFSQTHIHTLKWWRPALDTADVSMLKLSMKVIEMLREPAPISFKWQQWNVPVQFLFSLRLHKKLHTDSPLHTHPSRHCKADGCGWS